MTLFVKYDVDFKISAALLRFKVDYFICFGQFILLQIELKNRKKPQNKFGKNSSRFKDFWTFYLICNCVKIKSKTNHKIKIELLLTLLDASKKYTLRMVGALS